MIGMAFMYFTTALQMRFGRKL